MSLTNKKEKVKTAFSKEFIKKYFSGILPNITNDKYGIKKSGWHIPFYGYEGQEQIRRRKKGKVEA